MRRDTRPNVVYFSFFSRSSPFATLPARHAVSASSRAIERGHLQGTRVPRRGGRRRTAGGRAVRWRRQVAAVRARGAGDAPAARGRTWDLRVAPVQKGTDVDGHDAADQEPQRRVVAVERRRVPHCRLRLGPRERTLHWPPAPAGNHRAITTKRARRAPRHLAPGTVPHGSCEEDAVLRDAARSLRRICPWSA